MSPNTAIEIRNLVLDFHLRQTLRAPKPLRALDTIDLTIAPGEVVGLVGESGSGKTTLGKTLLGIHRPSAGQILYRGRDLAGLDQRGWAPLRRDLQMVFQDPLSTFNPRFTIASSLALPLRLHRVVPQAAIAAEVVALLTRVGLNPTLGGRYPHELSGGQLQRIAIARAIGVRPKLIVADEAVSKLDVSVRAQILNILKRVNREIGVSILFITHDLEVARFLCDRVAVMFFGRIVEAGPAAQIFAGPRHPYTASLLAARQGNGAAPDGEEEVAIPDVARACNYAGRCARRRPVCFNQRPALAAEATGHRFACFHPITP